MPIFRGGPFQFSLTASHIPGVYNDLADDLSRNRLPSFLCKMPNVDCTPSIIPHSLLQWLLHPNLDWTLPQLDRTVQFFCSQGIAQSTRQTYNSALRKFAEFYAAFEIISPFPVSESILCYFSSYLATKHLSPQTIRTYLSGIRHMQIVLGLPEPRAFSSLPRLRLVQSGIQRVYAHPKPG